MPYTIKEKKQYAHPMDAVLKAFVGAVEGLEGTLVSQDAVSGKMVAQFNKSIIGKVLGERTQVNVNTCALSSGESELELEAYPLDAVGNKLMFGARKGVTRTVLNWLYAHLENRL